VIEGAQGDSQPLKVLPIPEMYNWRGLGGSQLELANLRPMRATSTMAPAWRRPSLTRW
jgi:hypothetical protein